MQTHLSCNVIIEHGNHFAKVVSLKPVTKKSSKLKESNKGQTREFRDARKIKNLGISRQIVPNLPKCASNCRAKTSHEVRQAVWNEFRGIMDTNYRLKYLANLIQTTSPKRVCVPKAARRLDRSCINKYYLKFIEVLDNSQYRICKACFIIVFNLTKSKIRTVVDKKLKNGDDIQYKRGKNYFPAGKSETKCDELSERECSDSQYTEISSNQNNSPSLNDSECYKNGTFVDEDDPENEAALDRHVDAHVSKSNDDTKVSNQFITALQENPTIKYKIKKNRRSVKGQTKEFRDARKIKNLGISRQIVPNLRKCAFNCRVKTSQEERQEVWNEFRGIIDISYRLKFLANLIQTTSPRRLCVPKAARRVNRSCINKYYLKFIEELDNSRYQMCRVCFITVFNLSPSKIRTVVDKKLKEGDDIQYKRGKNNLPVANVSLTKYNCDELSGPSKDVQMAMMEKDDIHYNKPKLNVLSNDPENDIKSSFVDVHEDVFLENKLLEPQTLMEDAESDSNQITISVGKNALLKKLSIKGDTKEFRDARKIKNLGISRKLVPDLSSCSQDCRTKTSKEDRQIVWDEFRQFVDTTQRFEFLANLIKVKSPSRNKKSRKNNRYRTINFYLKWDDEANNSEYHLCKVCFMAVFNLTPSKIRTISSKIFHERRKTITKTAKPVSLVYTDYMSTTSSSHPLDDIKPRTEDQVIQEIPQRKGKLSVKGDTGEFRLARKIKNLGLDRELVPNLPKCSFDCSAKTSKEDRQQVWDEFRQILNMNTRLQYLINLVKIRPPNRSNKNAKIFRGCVNTYFLKYNENEDNSHYILCRMCFATVFNMSPGKIRTISTKKCQAYMGIEIAYRRGKDTPSSKILTPAEKSTSRANTSLRNKEIVQYKTALKNRDLKIDRELVPALPNCHFQCNAKTTKIERQTAWDEFRAIHHIRQRHQYLATLIHIRSSSAQYASHVGVGQTRNCTNIYYLRYDEFLDNSQYQICKSCFMTVFDLTETKLRAAIQTKMKQEQRVMMKDDRITKPMVVDVFEDIVVKEEYKVEYVD